MNASKTTLNNSDYRSIYIIKQFFESIIYKWQALPTAKEITWVTAMVEYIGISVFQKCCLVNL
jgi:hypothetical protein